MTTSIDQLPGNARVWIYQSTRTFSPDETARIRVMAQDFATKWVSHNRSLKAAADVYHNLFVVLMVDESQAGASGCSIDKSTYFIKELEQAFQTDFFDRLNFAYWQDEQVKMARREALTELYGKGLVNDETLIFDNMVNNKADFDAAWRKPIGQSWHKNFITG